MDEPPIPDDSPDRPTGADAGRTHSAQLTEGVSSFARRDRPTAIAFFETFFAFIRSSQGRRRPLSDDLVRAAFDLRDKQEQRAERQFRLLIAWAGAFGMASLATLVLLAFALRDHVELVRAVFEGVGLLVTHGAVGTGGYLIGRSKRRTS